MRKLCIKHKSFQRREEEFPVSETQSEEEEFEDQIQDVPEDTESPSEELLEVPPYKRRSTLYQEMVQ